MIRDLIEGAWPQASHAVMINGDIISLPKGIQETWINIHFGLYAPFLGVFIAILKTIPKTHCFRVATLPVMMGVLESMEMRMFQVLMTNLYTMQLGLVTNYLSACHAFSFLGCMCGSVFFGCLTMKVGKKVGFFVSMILSIGATVVIFLWVQGVMMKSLSAQERDFNTDGNSGGRKIRAFLDPNLAKNVGNTLGFGGAYSNNFQHSVLLGIIFGFTVAVLPMAQAAMIDLFSVEIEARHACCVQGMGFIWAGPFCGASFATFWYVIFDIGGAFMCNISNIFFCLILLVITLETKGMERKVEVSGRPCYLKAIYFALFMWPQGSAHIGNMFTFMYNDRMHLRSSDAGYLFCFRFRSASFLLSFIWMQFMRTLHVPTIGGMFFLVLACTNPLVMSLSMEWFSMFRAMDGFFSYDIYFTIYPAFLGQYMEISGIPLLLGVTAAIFNLGHFMAIMRWPGQLLCGDPMNCWRSQYLYSIAIFYNCGGDQGNINFVSWYLFAKSQRRQCCCPYRKLKPDAPEKCCPPCCLGPLVEETGGCPCPCCCASCSA